MTGRATQGDETLDFKIGKWCDGIGLMIRRTGQGASMETGAGIWPSIEKAKQIANETVLRLFRQDCNIVWTEVSD
jgi:hypothetical protein